MTKGGLFLLGAAAGAVLALLYAPATGEETREKISKKSQDLLDELNAKIDEGKEIVDDLKKRAVLVKNRVSEAFREELEAEVKAGAKRNGGSHVKQEKA